MASAIRTGFNICNSLLGPRCVVQQMAVRTRVKTRRKPTLLTRRTNPKVGLYAGQISNFDSTELSHFKAVAPKFPLTPEGTDYTPSPLHVVWRTQRLNGQPYWVKTLISDLGLADIKNDCAIIKNTPSNNRMLWHVKHVTRVKPLTFPQGIPTEADLGSTFINHLGQMIIDKQLAVDPKELENKKPPAHLMDKETLRKHLLHRWNMPWDT